MRLDSTARDHGQPRVRSLQRSLVGWTGRVLGTATAFLVAVSATLAIPAYAVETPIEVSPLELDFGAVNVGATSAEKSVQVTNTSTNPFGPITIFGGAPATQRFGASQDCQGVTLAGGASCTVSYNFSPTVAGPLSDTSSFVISNTSNQTDGETFNVALIGCGNPCPPTITSFTPTSGTVGTSVVITGTQLTGATAVTFGGVSATTINVNSRTQITTTVPGGALTGPIVVTTPGGTGTSTTNFTVVSVDRDRSIALNLRRHLLARGRVISDFEGCVSDVAVRVQRLLPDASWKNAGLGTTNENGGFRIGLRDKEGTYRALVTEQAIGDADVCLAAESNRDRHAH